MPRCDLQPLLTGSVPERRGADRRREALRALVLGSFKRRRHGPRRAGEHAASAVDWHHPQWLAIAICIVIFSAVDAFLTLALIDRGASEANPLMAPLVAGSAAAFALIKIGITAGSVVMLTQVAGIRAFGRIPVGALLYSAFVLYAGLLFYEVYLLNAV
ncbi:MAG: hypothetical protein JOZ89_02800 [Gammaproteobacteria bacterium]|nr:hypothetical protein [Gammaproteobacteria bacterium]